MEVVLAAMGGAAVSAYMESVKDGKNPHPKDVVCGVRDKMKAKIDLEALERDRQEKERKAAEEAERKRLLALKRAKESSSPGFIQQPVPPGAPALPKQAAQLRASTSSMSVAEGQDAVEPGAPGLPPRRLYGARSDRLDITVGGLALGDLLVEDVFEASNKSMENEDLNNLTNFMAMSPEAVTKLFLSNNNITEWGARQISTVLEDNNTVVAVNLRGNPLGDDGVRAVAGFLRSNTSVTDLSLAGVGMSRLGAASLAEALTYNTGVETLDISYNNISDEGAKAFAEMLMVNRKIRVVKLALTGVGDECGKAMGAMLDFNKTLEEVDLSRNNLTDKGGLLLFDGLVHNPTLKTLHLTANRVAVGAARKLADVISDPDSECCIETLHLSHNSISFDGMALLMRGLEDNSTITTFSCSGNEMNGELEEAIMALVARNIGNTKQLLTADEKLVQKLLSGQEIEDSDFMDDLDEYEGLSPEERQARLAAEGLIASPKGGDLGEVGLDGEELPDATMEGDVEAVAEEVGSAMDALQYQAEQDGAASITTLAELETKPYAREISLVSMELVEADWVASFIMGSKRDWGLSTVDLSDNFLGDTAAAMLASALNQSEAPIRTFKMGNNNVDDDGITKLAEALGGLAPGLVTLDVSDNMFGSEGVSELCAALSGKSLEQLDLKYNTIGDEGMTAIVALITSTPLKRLDLTCCELSDAGAQLLLEVVDASGLESVSLGENVFSEAVKKRLLSCSIAVDGVQVFG